MGAFLWGLVAFVLRLLGVGVRPSEAERHETTARDLGTQEARAQAAEQAVEAQQAALDLETRMQEAQAEVTAHQPSSGEPHVGTDLFHQD
ncbi:MAG: hypothetical protein AB1824_01255 [Acidobacteriota bacterium]